MDYIQSTLLAIIQGLTEFLPISSSAHLILPSQLLDWQDQGLAFDVAVHLGSLAAVVIYFRTELLNLVTGCVQSACRKEINQEAKLSMILVVATVPVILVGFIARDFVDLYLRSTAVIAFTTVFFGIFLWWSERRGTAKLSLTDLTWKSGLMIGLAQVLALIPGSSRSGMTMAAALLCNLEKEAASRFSFLLSIPTIGGAGLLMLFDLLDQEKVEWGLLIYAALVSGIVAWLCIHFFLKFINRIGFTPFVIYRLILGLILVLLML